MTDSEQKKAAKKFAADWQGHGYEKGETQLFWIDLLRNVFGVPAVEKFIIFEDQVALRRTSFIDARIPATRVLIEQKSDSVNIELKQRQSDGTMLTPMEQAQRYVLGLPLSQHPRYIVVCNFATFQIYDAETQQTEFVALADLPKEYYRLAFLAETNADAHLKREMELSIKAGEIVGVLYDEILKHYKSPSSPQTLKSLNALSVRLVFCLYAEDAGIFGKRNQFHDYLARFQSDDIRRALIDLFKILDTKPKDRDPYLKDDLAAFPYVNGGLFRDENIEIPQFGYTAKDLLLSKASDDFDWSDISPTIFGAIFESTLNPETRRSDGMHYTSIENIHKVIDPLFLDELKAEFAEIKAVKIAKTRKKKLLKLQDKIASLTFFDPACGSGNFLTETYISLRKLENEIISIINDDQGVLDLGDVIKVSIRQFYGIEINDFAVTVAKTALWIAESQMMKATEEIVHKNLDFLPLKSYSNIVEGNALRIDWESVVPKEKLSYIIGNPPFVGNNNQSDEQRADMLQILGNRGKTLDYVSGWYFKAAKLIHGTSVRCAFVSTNSITQGEQVAGLWKPMIENGIRIDFAHRTFRWDSEASIKAHVHCVIVGFSNMGGGHSCPPTFAGGISTGGQECPPPIIFDENGIAVPAKNISPYLIDAPTIFIESRSKPLCDVPAIRKGNQPTDGGNLIIEANEIDEFLKKEPNAKKFIKKLIGSKEYINQKPRYCLWLVGAKPEELTKMPTVLKRMAHVRELRLQSPDAGARRLANTPALFRETQNPKTFIVVPSVSSERRKYVPIGFLDENTIPTNLVLIIPDATLYHFGILTSSVHMAWMRAVCGRLKSDYRYSKDVVYNNFPWPNMGGGHSCPPCEIPPANAGGQECPPPTKNVTAWLNRGENISKSEHGALPHWHQDGKIQFITFRLADSLPQEKLDELKSRKDIFLNLHPKPWDAETAQEYAETVGKLTDKWLDAGHGSCVLAFPFVRKIVEETLLHDDGKKYILRAFVIMPNHVHVLIQLLGDTEVSALLKSWKGVSSRSINKILGNAGTLWQDESFDRILRSEIHYQHTMEYIKNNPKNFPSEKFTLFVGEEEIMGGGHSCPPCEIPPANVGGQECPPPIESSTSEIEATAQAILDARALYPDSSLADLYDETTMPLELRKAHQANDRAVMKAYGFVPSMTEPEIVADLMKRYQELTDAKR